MRVPRLRAQPPGTSRVLEGELMDTIFLSGIETPTVSCAVYFVQSFQGYINIGYTTAGIDARLSHYRSHVPLGAWLVGYIPCNDPRVEEKAQHEAWESYKVYGEWFAPCSTLLNYIRNFNSGIGQSITEGELFAYMYGYCPSSAVASFQKYVKQWHEEAALAEIQANMLLEANRP